MAILSILKFPDARLHTVAKPVATVDDRVRKIIKDMTDTMYDANGVGLAATQVNIHERIVVVDASNERNQCKVFINPEIIAQSFEKKEWEEGCLSVPETYDIVTRPDHVRIRALNEQGTAFEIDCDGLLAVCIQHEIDHLNGKVFIQHLSNLKQNRIKTKLKKQQANA